MEITLADIAGMIGGELKGDPGKIISGVVPIEVASPDDITFAGDAKFLKKAKNINAGAIIVPKNFESETGNTIRVENPQLAFAKLLIIFYPPSKKKYDLNSNIYIGKKFSSGTDTTIGPFAVIQDNVTLGERVTIHPNVVIADNVVIGDDVTIFPNVTVLERCCIGSRVIIHAGTVIGSDGFGFAPDGKKYHKILQRGFVQIDDDVEIGAGNTIDRATFGKTWIQKGVKTDNLVHIAHNVTVGENTVIVAQAGIAGSAKIGKHVVLAGQVAVAGHLEIGDDVIVGGRGGVSKSIPSGQIVSGAPHMPHRVWLKVQRIIPRLPELKKKIEDLGKRLKQVEKN